MKQRIGYTVRLLPFLMLGSILKQFIFLLLWEQINYHIEFEGRKFPIYLYDKKKDMLFVRRERARKV